jgi:hypothetical protein
MLGCCSLVFVNAGNLYRTTRLTRPVTRTRECSPGTLNRTPASCAGTFANGETNVNNSAYYSRVARSGRTAHVAIQFGVGILSQRWAWLGGGYCSYSGSDRTSVKQLGESIEEKDGASRSLISMEWEEEVAGVRDLAACLRLKSSRPGAVRISRWHPFLRAAWRTRDPVRGFVGGICLALDFS